MDPFIAEIRIMAFDFAPRGWASCDGQLMSIQQNTALFSVLGVTFGGDGKTTFGIPNFNGAVPVGAGQGPGLSYRQLGESAGSSSVSLTQAQIAQHTHAMSMSNTPGEEAPSLNNALGSGSQTYGGLAGLQAMGQTSLPPSGGTAPHNNMMPYLALRFCIATQGVFPPRG